MSDITFSFPHPGRILRPNFGQANRYAVAAARKKAKNLAFWTAKEQREELRLLHCWCSVWTRPEWHLPYSVTWYYIRGCAPDEDNILASCKAYLDGIAAAAGINDRDFHLAEIRRVKDRDKAGTVEITFIDDDTPPDFEK